MKQPTIDDKRRKLRRCHGDVEYHEPAVASGHDEDEEEDD